VQNRSSSTNLCRGCSIPVGNNRLSCPTCGQRHRAGAIPGLAGGILVLFGVAMVAGLAQSLVPEGPQGSAEPPARVEVVERWGVGLFGVEETVVAPRDLISEYGMARILSELGTRHPDRRFVQIHLFTDEAAARRWQAGRKGELGEGQVWFDRAWVGTYERNRRLRVEILTYAPEGLPRSERPRVLERPAG